MQVHMCSQHSSFRYEQSNMMYQTLIANLSLYLYSLYVCCVYIKAQLDCISLINAKKFAHSCVKIYQTRLLIQMALIVDMLKKISSYVSTLWELQEMRFEAIFDDVSYVTLVVISTAMSCFTAVRGR